MGIGTEFNSRPSEAELLWKCRDGNEFTETVLGRINFSDKRYGEKKDMVKEIHRLHFTVLPVSRLMQRRL